MGVCTYPAQIILSNLLNKTKPNNKKTNPIN